MISDSLAGLDEIPWAELHHAYGSAADVLGCIRDLASDSADRRTVARRTLSGTVFHQGTRYQASAYAVPFLARMACDPGIAERHKIVALLVGLAVGLDDEHLPYGYDIVAHRAAIAELLATTHQPPHERALWSPWSHQENALTTYDAVRANLPQLRALLRDSEPEVRAESACLLAWFPEDASQSIAELLGLLDTEIEPVVLANASLSLGLLGACEARPRLQRLLVDGSALVRWASGIASARLGVTGEDVISAITEQAEQSPMRVDRQILFHYGEITTYSAKTLAAFVPGTPPYIVPDQDPWA